MKPVYWDWLKKELGKAWGIIKLMPFAFWDLFKWIGSSAKETTSKEIYSSLSWENLCVLSGALSCMCFMGGLMLFQITKWYQDLMIGFVVISLFLISTYAYWRGKPND